MIDSFSTADAIHTCLKNGLPGADVVVDDESHLHARHAGQQESGGGHFSVRIRWPGFTSLNRLQRQRHVHEILTPMFKDGRIHALRLTLLCPDDFVKLTDLQ